MSNVRIAVLLAAALAAPCAVVAQNSVTLLPSGWRLSPPGGALVRLGTMPQGAAISPDGTHIAVVESGYNPPGLRILTLPSLHDSQFVRLTGAFGRPVWLDGDRIAVAGANVDAVYVVDAKTRAASSLAMPKGSWPCGLALSPGGTALAVIGDGDAAVALMRLRDGAVTQTFAAGAHPSGVAFSPDGRTLYVASRAESVVRAIDLAAGATRTIAAGLHPSAIALDPTGGILFVAAGDDDAIRAVRTADGSTFASYRFALPGDRYGLLPNALAVTARYAYVSFGGANGIARIRYLAGKTVGEFDLDAVAATGWYPTDVAAARDGTVYAIDGKGEGTLPNPQFDPLNHDRTGYVASQTYGSIRAIAPAEWTSGSGMAPIAANAAPHWTPPPAADTVVRPDGPLRHVIYIIKENRSYDQVLGDVAGADGDPSIVEFGRTITPNQHAIAERFGVFDNAYTNSQVSADGHNWTDAAIANDYVERFWPSTYAGRRKIYDYADAGGPDVPHDGYLWDAAARANISYRDYGEYTDLIAPVAGLVTTAHRGLQGHYDPRYVGWDLDYSDLDREAEWLREFRIFERDGNLPALEIVYLPNDHTSGTAPGKRTPQAYAAQNDLALGRLVDAVSHSRYWNSTAVFALEDDSQNGPDHVSDQRSTFYVASPYAFAGVHHQHYSTAAVLATIEKILDLRPLTPYDATAQPLYAAFGTRPVQKPYDAIAAKIDLDARNAKTAYGAQESARMDWSRPDAADPAELNAILERCAAAPSAGRAANFRGFAR